MMKMSRVTDLECHLSFEAISARRLELADVKNSAHVLKVAQPCSFDRVSGEHK